MKSSSGAKMTGNCCCRMLKFELAGIKWWQKPLVRFRGRVIPAELAVLSVELQPGENGVWLNSRGGKSGVVDLVPSKEDGYTTKRVPLPDFVSEELRQMYAKAEVKKGCPDLVLWSLKTLRMRLVEVKCPLWDRPSREQTRFLMAAELSGISAKVVEWKPRGNSDCG